jgi:hypothetical protein
MHLQGAAYRSRNALLNPDQAASILRLTIPEPPTRSTTNFGMADLPKGATRTVHEDMSRGIVIWDFHFDIHELCLTPKKLQAAIQGTFTIIGQMPHPYTANPARRLPKWNVPLKGHGEWGLYQLEGNAGRLGMSMYFPQSCVASFSYRGDRVGK